MPWENCVSPIAYKIAEGFEEAEAVITADMLKRAGIETKTAAVSEESSNIVKSSGALEIKCDINISDIKDIPDAVILPGGMAGTGNRG